MRPRLCLLVLWLLPTTLWGQSDCIPEPLPYTENFNTGFELDNGWHTPFNNDTTFQEEDNCWTICWLRSTIWQSLTSSYGYGYPSRELMHLRTWLHNLYDHTNLIEAYMFAVSPPMEEAPRRLQFEAGYTLAHMVYVYDPQVQDLQLADGARLAIGYITDNNDCVNSYVPLDTLKISTHWDYDEKVLQPFDIDLGRYFDTFPEPWRIAFRPERTDEYEDVSLLIDDIRISDEMPEYHCTENYVDTICMGAGYYQHGFHLAVDRTYDLGTRNYSYVDTSGCLISLSLTVTGTHTTLLVDTVPCGRPSSYAPDTVLSAGTHNFHLSDRNGCDSLVTLTIVQAWVTHLYDTIQQGDTLIFEGMPLTANGIYTHDTVASDGCDSLVVMHLRCLPLPTVNTDTLVFWFPNVFTPDLDENNRFGCITSAQVDGFGMWIYNRMGLLVWESGDINSPWDGKRKGQPVPQGTYVYYYRIHTVADNHIHTGIGTVTLLR